MKFGAGLREKQVPPLRHASVGMTNLRVLRDHFFLDHFEDKKIPVYKSLVTQCCAGIRMIVLIQ
jgi:hypothetical protein